LRLRAFRAAGTGSGLLTGLPRMQNGKRSVRTVGVSFISAVPGDLSR